MRNQAVARRRAQAQCVTEALADSPVTLVKSDAAEQHRVRGEAGGEGARVWRGARRAGDGWTAQRRWQ